LNELFPQSDSQKIPKFELSQIFGLPHARKTGSTFVYTSFVRLGEECSNTVEEVTSVIENVHKF